MPGTPGPGLDRSVIQQPECQPQWPHTLLSFISAHSLYVLFVLTYTVNAYLRTRSLPCGKTRWSSSTTAVKLLRIVA
jgi:hypothetical protein